jgi:hypothetical protein
VALQRGREDQGQRPAPSRPSSLTGASPVSSTDIALPDDIEVASNSTRRTVEIR